MVDKCTKSHRLKSTCYRFWILYEMFVLPIYALLVLIFFFELIRYLRGCEGVKDHETGPNLKKHSASQPFKVHVSSRNQEWALKVPFGFGTIIAFATLDYNDTNNDRDDD